MTSTDSRSVPAAAPDIEPLPDAPPADAPIRVAVDAALERKAEQLTVLYLGDVSDFTEHFVICHGTNERQVQAIADAVLKELRARGTRPLHVEGLNRGRWVLLDFGGEMVLHVFLGETREFYALERLWSDAPDVTAQFAE